jgi:ribosomal protein L31E
MISVKDRIGPIVGHKIRIRGNDKIYNRVHLKVYRYVSNQVSEQIRQQIYNQIYVEVIRQNRLIWNQ